MKVSRIVALCWPAGAHGLHLLSANLDTQNKLRNATKWQSTSDEFYIKWRDDVVAQVKAGKNINRIKGAPYDINKDTGKLYKPMERPPSKVLVDAVRVKM